MKESRDIWETVRTSSHPNVAYSDPSTHVSAKFFYFVIPHPSPSSRVASYFVNCIDAFSLYSLAEGERETEDFACSAYRTASFRVLHIPQTNVSLLRFSVTDGEPMVFLSMKFFRSLG